MGMQQKGNSTAVELQQAHAMVQSSAGSNPL
jgi:hypothetical protein